MILFFFTTLLQVNGLLPAHAIYLGVIDMNLGQSRCEIEIKVFTNDLEDALTNEFQHRVPLIGKDLEPVKEQLTTYFTHHFICTDPNRNYPLQWEGYQAEGDATWLRFTMPIPSEETSLTIRGDFLMELFPTQINVLKIKRDPDESPAAMARLTKNNPVYQLQLIHRH